VSGSLVLNISCFRDVCGGNCCCNLDNSLGYSYSLDSLDSPDAMDAMDGFDSSGSSDRWDSSDSMGSWGT
jgi:hypothetical protein